MSVFDKLAFWKKEPAMPDFGPDPLGLGGNDPLAGLDQPIGGTQDFQQPAIPKLEPLPQESQRSAYPQPSAFQQPMQQPFSQPQPSYNKDLEIVSSKLDSIRAMLESLNQRVANIERIAYGEQEEARRRRW